MADKVENSKGEVSIHRNKLDRKRIQVTRRAPEQKQIFDRDKKTRLQKSLRNMVLQARKDNQVVDVARHPIIAIKTLKIVATKSGTSGPTVENGEDISAQYARFEIFPNIFHVVDDPACYRVALLIIKSSRGNGVDIL